MIIYRHDIIPTEEFTDITSLIERDIESSEIKSGLVMVYTKHTTTCVRLLEPETLLKMDMHDFMERLASSNCRYRHDDIEHRDVPPEERLNGYSHLRAMLLNHQENIPLINGKLDLGHWQKVFYIECDLGKEDRTFNVAIIPFPILEMKVRS
jgi:secondary thiamine-phosphate synthase enzyme